MGFLQDDFIGNPHKPEFVIEGDIEYPSDDDQALFEVEDLMPGDPDLILFDNIDIDNDEDYVPEEEDDYEDEYDNFLMDEDSCFDDDDDEEEVMLSDDDDDSTNDNESSDEKSTTGDNFKVNGEHKNISDTNVNSGTGGNDSNS